MSHVVVVTSERIDAHPAGPGLRALGLARGLSHHGHDVEVVAPSSVATVAGLRMIAPSGLASAARTADAIIIPASLVGACPLALKASSLCVDFAGPFPLEAIASGADPGTVRRAEEAAVFATTNADLIICAHERQVAYSRELCDRHGRPIESADRRYVLVPFGIPDKLGRAAVSPSHRADDDTSLRLVWPGGIWDWLDPFIAVEALRGLPDRISIDFWGTQSPDPSAPRMQAAERLARTVEDRGMQHRVRMVGWVPPEEFDHRLSTFDLAVTFDHAGVEATHAFRTRLLHALSHGVPTLATRGEFVADLAAGEGAGWVCEPGDADGLRRVIAELDYDRAAIRRASASALSVAKRFDYDLLVEPLHLWLGNPERFRLPRRDKPPLASRVRRVLRQFAA
ncbi:MAG: glycosyltransferase [Candidatus Nanopelagicaceae bacterium]